MSGRSKEETIALYRFAIKKGLRAIINCLNRENVDIKEAIKLFNELVMDREKQEILHGLVNVAKPEVIKEEGVSVSRPHYVLLFAQHKILQNFEDLLGGLLFLNYTEQCKYALNKIEGLKAFWLPPQNPGKASLTEEERIKNRYLPFNPTAYLWAAYEHWTTGASIEEPLRYKEGDKEKGIEGYNEHHYKWARSFVRHTEEVLPKTSLQNIPARQSSRVIRISEDRTKAWMIGLDPEIITPEEAKKLQNDLAEKFHWPKDEPVGRFISRVLRWIKETTQKK